MYFRIRSRYHLVGKPNMSSVLDNPMIRESALRLDVEQYHRLCESGVIAERTELIDGIVVRKMGKSPLHTWTVEFLAEWFRAQLPAGHTVRVEQPLTLTTSEPEPDIAIVVGTRDHYRTSHPTTAKLVVEVAVSSEEVDREKSHVYASAGIPEYWLLFPQKREALVFGNLQSGRYQKAERVTVSSSLFFEGRELRFSDLFPVPSE